MKKILASTASIALTSSALSLTINSISTNIKINNNQSIEKNNSISKYQYCMKTPYVFYHYNIAQEDGIVQTLEGDTKYSKGDYIMTGVKGEKWRIRPDRFLQTYTPVLNINETVARINCSSQVEPNNLLKRFEFAKEVGVIDTAWGAKLKYKVNDAIINHDGKDDKAPCDKEIFELTYVWKLTPVALANFFKNDTTFEQVSKYNPLLTKEEYENIYKELNEFMDSEKAQEYINTLINE